MRRSAFSAFYDDDKKRKKETKGMKDKEPRGVDHIILLRIRP